MYRFKLLTTARLSEDQNSDAFNGSRTVTETPMNSGKNQSRYCVFTLFDISVGSFMFKMYLLQNADLNIFFHSISLN